jgi:hypothetical protein
MSLRQVHAEQATRELTDAVDYPGSPLSTIIVYKVRGGYAFTYTASVEAHGLYGTSSGNPFRTAERALRAARNPDYPASEVCDV